MRDTPKTKWVQVSTWMFGIVMLLIGGLDAVGLFELGEYGIASGFGHIFYALWGLTIGHWFWFKAPPRISIGDPVDGP